MSQPPVTVAHRSHEATVPTEVEEVFCKCRLPKNETCAMAACDGCSCGATPAARACHGTAASQMLHCTNCRNQLTALQQSFIHSLHQDPTTEAAYQQPCLNKPYDNIL
ncbi:hypothetical protein GWK47_016903 [Chionoecetes opilio]|uniref:Uncharacterized protein n=1 Tax=Chionoecetes opilio TaxID=41210 RepID=A0A8J5BYU7_CHIOP|nr:hypothetical protein GWK47_016903 [Chionoecetes opilio]